MSGQLIFVPDEKNAWVPAKVLEVKKGKYVKVKLNPLMGEGKEKKVEGDLANFDSVTIDELNEECDNVADIKNFNEGIILHHIKQRFARGTIYTSVGNILVAVNPYRNLDIYDKDLMSTIWSKISGGTDGSKIPPHVFAIGGQALYRMQKEYKDQSILISGESGAGKTETTKRILEFLSNTASSRASMAGQPIETQILESNPILESFGNAKTLRNNNSSRFGKFMRVRFDPSHRIHGCAIDTYLLEKVRVCSQLENERGFHVFYMMLAGAPKEMKRQFHLNDATAEGMHYLNGSNCFKVSGRSEKKLYVQLIEAFEKLGFDGSDIEKIFQLLASILHLGNLFFEETAGNDGSQIVGGDSAIITIAQLMGIHDTKALAHALCFKELPVGGDVTQVALRASLAMEQRDAVAKYVYSQIFDYIVLHVNKQLDRSAATKEEGGSLGNVIGVLDIFGFEVFQSNSFEQLCINYSNERLQTFFNTVIFKTELELYEAEGVDCSGIAYQDNLGCVKVIDGPKNTGIFSLLDEECVVPQGSDEKLLSKLNATFAATDNPDMAHAKYYKKSRKLPNTFIVVHFAGDVTYDITGFREKTKDTLHESMAKVLETSTIDIVTYREAKAVPSSRPGAAKEHRLTVSTSFKRNLDSLMSNLVSTEPHFVRCIKPNEVQKGDKFDANLTLRQMKYSGLFEAIKIRRMGFAVRLTFTHFINRYKCCVPKELWHACDLDKPIKRGMSDDELKAATQTLLNALQRPDVVGDAMINTADDSPAHGDNTKVGLKWSLGNSKIFLRTSAISKVLEDYLNANAMNRIIMTIQMAVRRWLRQGKAERLLQKTLADLKVSRAMEKREMGLFEMEDLSSQAEELRYRAEQIKLKQLAEEKRRRLIEEEKREKARKMKFATVIQACVRGFLARMQVRVFFCESMFEKALKTRSEPLLQEALLKTKKLNVHSPALHLYQRNARQLIAEVLAESHIAHQLKEAMASGSLYLLERAMTKAKDSRMTFLSEYEAGLRALAVHKRVRQTVTWLDTELTRADTVPKLVESADYIMFLLQQATERGLHHEHVCRTAVERVGKVKNLLRVRNKLRFHVETASLKGMAEALAEREPLVALFGEALFQEEVDAVSEMKRMIRLLPLVQAELPSEERRASFVSGPTGGAAAASGETKADGDEDSDLDEEEAMDSFDPTAPLGLIGSETLNPDGADGNSDLLLPAWVRRMLLLKRQFIMDKNEDKLRRLSVKLDRMVPDKVAMNLYTRIFKWNVAFCSWMPTHPKNIKRRHMFTDRDLEQQKEETEKKNLAEGQEMLKKLDNAGDADDMSSIISDLNLSGRASTAPGSIRDKRMTEPGTAAGTPYSRLGKKGPVDRFGRSKTKQQEYTLGLSRGGGAGFAFAAPKLKEGQRSVAEKAADIKKKKGHSTTSAFQAATGPYSKRRAKSDVIRKDTYERGRSIKSKLVVSGDDALTMSVAAGNVSEKLSAKKLERSDFH